MRFEPGSSHTAVGRANHLTTATCDYVWTLHLTVCHAVVISGQLMKVLEDFEKSLLSAVEQFTRVLHLDLSQASVSADTLQRVAHQQRSTVTAKVCYLVCHVNRHLWPAYVFLACLHSIDRLHVSSGDCLDDKKEDYQNCSVLYCVTQFCTVICILIWAVLTDELF